MATPLTPGTTVWLDNPYPERDGAYRRALWPSLHVGRPLWVPATVQSFDSQGNIRVVTSCEPPLEVVVAAGTELMLREEFPDGPPADLESIRYINDAQVVSATVQRFLAGHVYSASGNSLLAVNPYQAVKVQGVSLYDGSVMRAYCTAPFVGKLDADGDPEPDTATVQGVKEVLNPHVFGTAFNAYTVMRKTGLNQAIIISGESGSGKTETTKHILRFLASVSATAVRRQSQASRSLLVERLMLESTVILESFGNATTPKNHNSSRFAKYVELMFVDARMVGCRLSCFLLEKTRVQTQQPGERNFHIFYQMLAGLGAPELHRLGLAHPETLQYLLQTDDRGRVSFQRLISSRDDAADFAALTTSLTAFGLGAAQQAGLFRIMAAVLLLGNLEFSGDESSVVDTPSLLEHCAALLGISDAALSTALCAKAVKGVVTGLRPAQASSHRHALAKALFGKAFAWLVRHMNGAIAAAMTKIGMILAGADGAGLSPRSVGVLDLFGFEVFHVNSFEQLCINFASEKLQQFFVNSTIRFDVELYTKEHITVPPATFSDNSAVIELIEGRPLGVFALLDEACLFNSTDSQTLVKFGSVLRRSLAFSPGGKGASASTFVIKHSMADVCYTIDGFVDKNRDHFPSQLDALCRGSRDPLVWQLFHDKMVNDMPATEGSDPAAAAAPMEDSTSTAPPVSTDPSSMVGAGAFAGMKVKAELQDLLATIRACGPHFVLCVLPNFDKRPAFIDPAVVLNQLRSLGVMDGLRLRQAGYPSRLPFSEFYARYLLMRPKFAAKYGAIPPPTARWPQIVQELASSLWPAVAPAVQPLTLAACMQIGMTKVFMRRIMYDALEGARDKRLRIMDNAAVRVQAHLQMVYHMLRFRKVRKGVCKLQAAARGVGPRRDYARALAAICKVQATWRMFIYHRHYRCMQGAGMILTRSLRLLMHKSRYARLRVTTRIVHTLARSFLLRRLLLQQYQQAVVLQRYCRRFLVRNRLYWARVRAALLVQALWRGHRLRTRRHDIVQHLHDFRCHRAEARFFGRVFAKFKGRLVRDRFLVLRGACIFLQRRARTMLARRRFLLMRAAAIHVQTAVRRMLARRRVGHLRATKSAAEEAWALFEWREDECMALEAIGAKIRSPEFWRAVDVAGQKRSQKLGARHNQWLNLVHRIADVDILVNYNEMYPSGWVSVMNQLQDKLIAQGVQIADVAVGSSHTAVLTSDGRIFTFGWGDHGQLGLGDVASVDSPTHVLWGSLKPAMSYGRAPAVTPDNIIESIVTGAHHTLAITASGQVYAWGSNSYGQLGLGLDLKARVRTPTRVTSVTRPAASIAAGAWHSAIVTKTGGLLIAGHGQTAGQGTLDHVTTFTVVVALSHFAIKAVACGWTHTAALSTAGDLYTWGQGDRGQLGHGKTTHRLMPILVSRNPVAGLIEDTPADLASTATSVLLEGSGASVATDTGVKPFRFIAVSCGARHTAAITASGNVFTWGANTHGQLGLGHQNDVLIPQLVAGTLRGIRLISVACGWRSTKVLSDDNQLFAWGQAGVSISRALVREEAFGRIRVQLHEKSHSSGAVAISDALVPFDDEAEPDDDDNATRASSAQSHLPLIQLGVAPDTNSLREYAQFPPEPRLLLCPQRIEIDATAGYLPSMLRCSWSQTLSVDNTWYRASRLLVVKSTDAGLMPDGRPAGFVHPGRPPCLQLVEEPHAPRPTDGAADAAKPADLSDNESVTASEYAQWWRQLPASERFQRLGLSTSQLSKLSSQELARRLEIPPPRAPIGVSDGKPAAGRLFRTGTSSPELLARERNWRPHFSPSGHRILNPYVAQTVIDSGILRTQSAESNGAAVVSHITSLVGADVGAVVTSPKAIVSALTKARARKELLKFKHTPTSQVPARPAAAQHALAAAGSSPPRAIGNAKVGLTGAPVAEFAGVLQGDKWDEYQAQMEADAMNEAMVKTRAEKSQRAAQVAAARVQWRAQTGSVLATQDASMLDQFDPVLLVATRNAAVSVQDLRKPKAMTEQAQAPPSPATPTATDPVEIFRKHSARSNGGSVNSSAAQSPVTQEPPQFRSAKDAAAGAAGKSHAADDSSVAGSVSDRKRHVSFGEVQVKEIRTPPGKKDASRSSTSSRAAAAPAPAVPDSEPVSLSDFSSFLDVDSIVAGIRDRVNAEAAKIWTNTLATGGSTSGAASSATSASSPPAAAAAAAALGSRPGPLLWSPASPKAK